MSAAATLEDRVAALEQTLAAVKSSPPALDSLTPNPLTFSGGTVGAKFTGQVNAQGLVLPSGANQGTATAVNQIQWQRLADGAVVAQEIGWDDSAGNRGLSLLCSADRPGGYTYAVLAAQDDTGVARANIQVSQYGRGTAPPAGTLGFPTAVAASAGGRQVQIIDASDNTSFIRANKFWNVGNYQLAFGITQLGSFAAGGGQVFVAVPWANNHYSFIGSCTATTNNGFNCHNLGTWAWTTSYGVARFAMSALDYVQCAWQSIGN